MPILLFMKNPKEEREEKEKAIKRLHDDYRRQFNSIDLDDEFVKIQTCNGSAEN